ncbi:MAG: hypothetical protein KC466_19830 [Myxococcales bacterium]|nr:hypothetical protein [Myxococcales bacterium]
MRVLVLGVPEGVADALPGCEELGAELVGIILSKPEEPFFPEVRTWADAGGCWHATVDRLRDDALLDHVARELRPDLLLAVGFNTKVPGAWLKLAPLGAVNLHPSLLPRLRGPCPQFWAIARGETRTGVTAHYMTERFDDGPIIAAERIEIDAADTMGSLLDKFKTAEVRLFHRVIEDFSAAGRRPCLAQNDSAATWAPKVTAGDLEIDVFGGMERAMRLVRAANPHYGARTRIGGRWAAVYQARASAAERRRAAVGETTIEDGVPTLWCVDGGLVPEVLHLEGVGLIDHWRLATILGEKSLKIAA